jgi:cobalt-zinc-cadmium resistance protein CzcA
MSHGIGSEVQRPLATVVVGGLSIGPLFLLMVVPALQALFLQREPDPMRERIQGILQRTRDEWFDE